MITAEKSGSDSRAKHLDINLHRDHRGEHPLAPTPPSSHLPLKLLNSLPTTFKRSLLEFDPATSPIAQALRPRGLPRLRNQRHAPTHAREEIQLSDLLAVSPPTHIIYLIYQIYCASTDDTSTPTTYGPPNHPSIAPSIRTSHIPP